MACAHDHLDTDDPIVSLAACLDADENRVHLALVHCPDLDDETLRQVAQAMSDALAEVAAKGYAAQEDS